MLLNEYCYVNYVETINFDEETIRYGILSMVRIYDGGGHDSKQYSIPCRWKIAQRKL